MRELRERTRGRLPRSLENPSEEPSVWLCLGKLPILLLILLCCGTCHCCAEMLHRLNLTCIIPDCHPLNMSCSDSCCHAAMPILPCMRSSIMHGMHGWCRTATSWLCVRVALSRLCRRLADDGLSRELV